MKLSFTMLGSDLGVYDEHTGGGIYSFYVGPFDEYDTASEWAEEWTDEWRMGYGGRAQPVSLEEGYFVRCSRWTSCD